ncbi:Lrp/AsnC family transcriptional regulator [Yoonia sp. MH D7]
MDDLDSRLILFLRRNGRATLSELAADLKVTRATVRVRMDRLQSSGQIAGFTVQTPADVAPHPVRGMMMLEIAGRGTERVVQRLRTMLAVTAVHTTNGTWDLIVEIGTNNLEAFDTALTAIRTFDGVARSETSLLLTSRR